MMIKIAAVITLSCVAFGCAKHELVSVNGQDTNRWKVIKDWNGQKGWIGATYEDDTGGLSFESFKNDVMFSLLTFNKSDCNATLVVDGVNYYAQPKNEQRAGYSVCIQYVTGDKAFEIAAKMSMSKTVNFNGHDTDVRGFDSIMNNYFIKSGVAPASIGNELNSLALVSGASSSNSMSFSSSGNWKVSKTNDMSIAALKSISDSKSVIMMAKGNGESVFSYIETRPYEDALCKKEINISDEYFSVNSDKHSDGGEYSCAYTIHGSEAEYAFTLIGKKKTTYIDGVVFDTSGYEDIKRNFIN